MSVIAKFRCNSITDHGNFKDVKLAPVYPGPDASEEDKAFWQATPQGSLEMRVDNPNASMQFSPGKTYYLTFEEADVPAAA